MIRDALAFLADDCVAPVLGLGFVWSFIKVTQDGTAWVIDRLHKRGDQ